MSRGIYLSYFSFFCWFNWCYLVWYSYRSLFLLVCKEKWMLCLEITFHENVRIVKAFQLHHFQDLAALTVLQLMRVCLSNKNLNLPQDLLWRKSSGGEAYICETNSRIGRFSFISFLWIVPPISYTPLIFLL